MKVSKVEFLIKERPCSYLPLVILSIANHGHYATHFLKCFDNSVFNKIETLEPSARGEYEVTDLCNIYVSENKCLNLNISGGWIDAGTPERIIELEQKLSQDF